MKKKHVSIILTCVGSAGVVLTSYLTAKATIKAVDILKDEELTTKEKIVKATPSYIPSIVIGASTIACILGSNIVNQKYQASLMSAYALLNSSYSDYKRKLKELYGEEAHKHILESLDIEKARNVDITAECIGGITSLEIDGEEAEKRLFYDEISERYFESTVEQVLAAEYHLNRNYILRGDASLNEFYEFLGLDYTDSGDVLGWDMASGLYWIDFEHLKIQLEDGLECCHISIPFGPTEMYIEN